MDKRKKGLADTNEGEFVLNESGTTVNTDRVSNPTTEETETPPATEELPAEDRSLREKYGFEEE